MKRFNIFLEEIKTTPPSSTRVSDDIVETFGRHNPPHLGHKLTFDHADKLAKGIGDKAPGQLRLNTSRSQDPKKNPLPFAIKLDHLKRMFPQYADKFDEDPNVRTIIQAAQKAHGEGYKNFHFVGGGDRRTEMENLLRRYNGDLYNFNNIYSHSAGDRYDDTDENNQTSKTLTKADQLKKFLQGLSASKMRGYASQGKMEDFLKGIPISDKYTNNDATELFNAIRSHMRLGEEWEIDYRSHKENIRELYKSGHLYLPGDIVKSLSTGLVGEIKRCGTNHVICVTEDGIMFKSFVHDVY